MADVLMSQAGMRIVRLLVGNPPQTMAQLIRATGVTRTAVSEQLKELVAGGFAVRTMERLQARGRPRYCYTATQASQVLLFARSQEQVVPAIWKAIDDVGGRTLTEKIVKRVTQSVARHYRPRVNGSTPQERLRQLADVWSAEGHVVELHEDDRGRMVLRKRSCAFVTMFEETRTICGVDSELLRVLVQGPIRRLQCRHDGAPCCTFELCRAAGN